MGKKSKKRNPAKPRSAAQGKKKVPGGKGVRGTVVALVALTVAAVAVSAGIGIWKVTSDSSESGVSKLSDSVKFPSWISAPGASFNSLKAYKAVVDHYDDMSHIPCFCGCGQHSGHKSVQDCFVKSLSGNNVLFDDHGAGWQLCVDVALDALDGINDGKPIQEIRKDIDDKYGDKYGDSATPTPPV